MNLNDFFPYVSKTGQDAAFKSKPAVKTRHGPPWITTPRDMWSSPKENHHRKSSPNTWNLQKKPYMFSIHSQTERIPTCQIDRSEKDIERIKKNILLRDYLKNIRRINKNNSIDINQGRNAETYCTSFPRFFIPRLSISSFLCLFI